MLSQLFEVCSWSINCKRWTQAKLKAKQCYKLLGADCPHFNIQNKHLHAKCYFYRYILSNRDKTSRDEAHFKIIMYLRGQLHIVRCWNRTLQFCWCYRIPELFVLSFSYTTDYWDLDLHDSAKYWTECRRTCVSQWLKSLFIYCLIRCSQTMKKSLACNIIMLWKYSSSLQKILLSTNMDI